MDYMKEYRKWLESPALNESERAELTGIGESEIKSRFYAPLEFGTAGLRGIMGAGINRMNTHVIKQATQGMAELIAREGEDAKLRGVVICYDSRNNSRVFAETSASVMAANGIFVRMFEDIRPTPELSFAIREYNAVAGINITASHNPKEYNGYKVYWEDGAQLPPEHAAEVSKIMLDTDIFSGARFMDFNDALNSGLIKIIGAETDGKFISRAVAELVNPQVIAEASGTLKIVYTPFHGTGYKLIPEALALAGVKDLVCVPEQMIPDGDFPSVTSPNPEEPGGFQLAVRLADSLNADIIIGTDPDADRIAIMARNGEGALEQISGNQLGVLLLHYLLSAKQSRGTLPPNAAALKTIVSTNMAKAVCEAFGIYMTETFTGFKFMAEKIKEFEKVKSYETIFSFEESIGYMSGSFVRDKDAVTTALIVCETASHYALLNMTLFDALDALYRTYGYYREKTVNLVMPGLDGLEKMRNLMSALRENPPGYIGDIKVSRIRDYLAGTALSTADASSEPLDIHGSDVLYYELEDGSAFIVRPSGTEPKIKVYILVKGLSNEESLEKIEKCSKTAESLKG